MDLSLPVQPPYPQDCAQLPMKQSHSALCQRPLEFRFDPRFLSDWRYGPRYGPIDPL
jgi:hypothetical protein